MTDQPDQFDPQLEAYLDGLLQGEELAAFEARVAREPALRQAVEQQRRIDAALRASHHPQVERLAQLAQPRERLHQSTKRQRVNAATGTHSLADASGSDKLGGANPALFWFKRVAAAVVIAVLLTWGLSSWLDRPGRGYQPPPRRDMITVYRDSIASGFNPQWQCETEAEFASTFSYRLGQPLTLAAAPNVENLGLAYANVLSPSTIYLLARVDGAEVVVFVDRADRDTVRSIDPAAGLNLFRRELGSLVLYELTPLARPHILPLFESPPQPEAPPGGATGRPGVPGGPGVPGAGVGLACPSNVVRAGS